MRSLDQLPDHLYDMDHVLVGDRRIYRVLGNFALDDPTGNGEFLGYNLYSPDTQGDRTFRGERYTKNYTEDRTLPPDVLDTYDVLTAKDIVEHFDPIKTAQDRRESYEGTVWAELYDELTQIFDKETVGIFGSALPGSGLHLTADGGIKNDVDFFIEGLENVAKLEEHLPKVREGLGFMDYTPASQQGIIESWKKVFRNPNNSFGEIMQRRWSGMQLSDEGRIVLNTFRFRDRTILTPPELLDRENIVDRNVSVSGVASDAHRGNLYPRMFTIENSGQRYPVYSFWWKFSSPVRENDKVSVCGDIVDVNGQQTLRLTNYEDHWVHI
jgi:predicted nucleotidyltransferase